jgi:hypothetical protein
MNKAPDNTSHRDLAKENRLSVYFDKETRQKVIHLAQCREQSVSRTVTDIVRKAFKGL